MPAMKIAIATMGRDRRGKHSVSDGDAAPARQNMKTIPDVEDEIRLAELRLLAAATEYDETKAKSDAAFNVWIRATAELNKLRQRLEIMKELAESYRGQERLPV